MWLDEMDDAVAQHDILDVISSSNRLSSFIMKRIAVAAFIVIAILCVFGPSIYAAWPLHSPCSSWLAHFFSYNMKTAFGYIAAQRPTDSRQSRFHKSL